MEQTILSKATYNNYISKKKERKKQQYITVGSVRMFREPSAKHLQLLAQSIPHIQRRWDKMLHNAKYYF
jgi:hypothetical protein